jgi:hypothetical protein
VLELAILGLLKEKPMHGYELKKRLSFMLGHFWTVSYSRSRAASRGLTRSRKRPGTGTSTASPPRARPIS